MDNMLMGLRSFLDRSERKEFEAHAKTRGYTLFTRAYHPNHYDDDVVDEMWLSWLQAKKLLLRDIETYLATISRGGVINDNRNTKVVTEVNSRTYRNICRSQ